MTNISKVPQEVFYIILMFLDPYEVKRICSEKCLIPYYRYYINVNKLDIPKAMFKISQKPNINRYKKCICNYFIGYFLVECSILGCKNCYCRYCDHTKYKKCELCGYETCHEHLSKCSKCKSVICKKCIDLKTCYEVYYDNNELCCKYPNLSRNVCKKSIIHKECNLCLKENKTFTDDIVILLTNYKKVKDRLSLITEKYSCVCEYICRIFPTRKKSHYCIYCYSRIFNTPKSNINIINNYRIGYCNKCKIYRSTCFKCKSCNNIYCEKCIINNKFVCSKCTKKSLIYKTLKEFK